jgi:hypothetical protein
MGTFIRKALRLNARRNCHDLELALSAVAHHLHVNWKTIPAFVEGEPFPCVLPFAALVLERLHALAERLDQALLLRGPSDDCGLEQRGPGRWPGRGRLQPPVRRRPLPVPGDGVATNGEIPLDAPIRLAHLQPPKQFSDVLS